MLSLLLATLLTQATMSPTSDLSTNRVRATGAAGARALRDHLRTLPDAEIVASGTTTGRGFADRAADILSVKDFGAKGDGTTDDTAALNAALAAARARVVTQLPSGGFYTASIPTVLFPPGRYIVNGALTTNGYVQIEGGGKAMLVQQDQAAVTLDVSSAYMVTVKGVVFMDGLTAIRLTNDNLGATIFTLEDNEFHHQRGFAVRATPLDGFNPADPVHNHLSAQLIIKGGRFDDPIQGVQTYADSTTIKDVVVLWSNYPGGAWAVGNRAFIENHGEWDPSGGHLKLEHFFGNPGMFGTSQVRWIDNWGSVWARHCRFGGEDGGIPVVYNYAKYRDTYPYYSYVVSITDSDVWTGGGTATRADTGAMVFPVGGQVPGLFEFKGNVGPIGGPLINNVGIADMAAYVSSISSPSLWVRGYVGPTNPSWIEPGTGYLWPPELAPFITDARFADPAAGPTVLTRSGTGVVVQNATQSRVYLWTQPDDSQSIITAPDPAHVTSGQTITIVVKNGTGGAITNPTFSGFTMGASVPPAAGLSRTYTFTYMGNVLGWMETGRSGFEDVGSALGRGANIGTGIFSGTQATGLVTIQPLTGNDFTIPITTNGNFTMAAPTYPTIGGRVTLRFKNTSGGAAGTITWDAVFKLASWTQPADGFNRTIDFQYDGTNWIEVARTAADVPN